MTVVGLIRHGSTYWNKEGRAQGHTDNSLDEEGFEQARRLAERLAGEAEWRRIYSSDLLRARQTAEIIQERLGIGPVIIDERLREMYGGQIEGTTEKERQQRWGAGWKELDLGLETPDAGMLRGSEAVQDIASRHPGEGILIVSHGALIHHLLRRLVPQQQSEMKLGNTSLTILNMEDDLWECALYNCITHLKS
ncbi:histidine phosphatase family protein [Paenibacillus sp. CAA11]|uniref:histidine phosphatase family protein n=1 Tax=Paenibacillus sp. CAA11 TaxID=1532905 RepID=UPI000D33D652|nr:histidine phosphatase family protein [Paenibacillus sp. CAA11]AWB44112.1 histidine phosphatase family protein [Paenibacillus sp. CAA11]